MKRSEKVALAEIERFAKAYAESTGIPLMIETDDRGRYPTLIIRVKEPVEKRVKS